MVAGIRSGSVKQVAVMQRQLARFQDDVGGLVFVDLDIDLLTPRQQVGLVEGIAVR